jgi:hypothetical protein
VTGPDPRNAVPLPVLPPARSRAARATHLVRDVLRLEDLVLIVWVGLQPIVFRALGVGPSQAPSGGLDLMDAHNPLLGLVELVAVGGALVCLATRPAMSSGAAGRGAADFAGLGPLTGGLLLATVIGTQNLFGSAEAGFGVAFVAIVVAFLLSSATPPLAVPVRRVLVTPYVLVSASLFNGLVGQVGGLFDLHSLLGQGLAQVAQVLPSTLVVMVPFAAVYYLMLVYAPRQLAVADGGPVAWLVRFLVFLAVEVLTVSWLAMAA